jgi:predicted ATP-binding protein involved in virulence
MYRTTVEFQVHPGCPIKPILKKTFAKEYVTLNKGTFIRVWDVTEDLLEKYTGEELLEYYGVDRKYYISHIEEEPWQRSKLKNNLRDI